MTTIRRIFYGNQRYMRDCWFFTFIVLGIVALIAGIFGGLYLFISTVDSAACKRDAERFHTDWEYDFWASGCYVEINGTMVPLENIRVTDDGEVVGDDAG